MATRPLDEIGTLGEEIVGPIDLPRPQPSFWTYGVLAGVFSAICSIGLEKFIDFLAANWEWTDAEINLYQPFLFALFFGAIFGATQWLWNEFRPRFRIERGRHIEPIFLEEPIVFRSNYSKIDRLISLGLIGCVDAFLIWALFNAPRWYAQLFVLILSIVCVASTWHIFWFFTRPLLVLDAHGAWVAGRRIEWTQVQSAEVQHRVELFGGFSAVRLILRDEKGRKLAKVDFPAEKFRLFKEEKLLASIAAQLGRKYEPLAQPDINWL